MGLGLGLGLGLGCGLGLFGFGLLGLFGPGGNSGLVLLPGFWFGGVGVLPGLLGFCGVGGCGFGGLS